MCLCKGDVPPAGQNLFEIGFRQRLKLPLNCYNQEFERVITRKSDKILDTLAEICYHKKRKYHYAKIKEVSHLLSLNRGDFHNPDFLMR